MIILDTNVLSALMLSEPEVVVATWLDRQARTSVWTTSVTIFEIRYGLIAMPAGRRRTERHALFERVVEESWNVAFFPMITPLPRKQQSSWISVVAPDGSVSYETP